MTSDTVILALKTIFSEAGVPTILISDNGRQYCSEEFKELVFSGRLSTKLPLCIIPKAMHMLRELLVSSRKYTPSVEMISYLGY